MKSENGNAVMAGIGNQEGVRKAAGAVAHTGTPAGTVGGRDAGGDHTGRAKRPGGSECKGAVADDTPNTGTHTSTDESLYVASHFTVII